MPSIGSSSVAYATLVTNHDYGIGAAVLGFKLKKFNTSADRIIMVTNSVPQNTITLLEHYWDKVVNVSQLESSDNEMLVLLKRPELSVTYSKLNVWKLTDYQKIAFLDADMMPLSNVDDLFEYEELSACRDIGWPDCFNSGLFVLKPSVETFNSLLKFAETEGSFDGGDQGLLNSYFSSWSHGDIRRHIPFTYNVNPNASYTYLPAYKKFAADIKMVHFLGALKPWHYQYSHDRIIGQNLSEHTYGYLLEWHRTAHQLRLAPTSVPSSNLQSPSFEASVTPGAAAVEPSVTGEDEIEEHVEEKGNVKDILAHISSQIKEKDAQQGQKY